VTRALQLTRPLVAIDLETTGLDIDQDRIVELSCVKIMPNGDREIRTRRLNPGRPIAPRATAVHGMTDADVADSPTFTHIARSLHAFLAGCDFTGFNFERFDLPILSHEFARAGLAFPDPAARVIDSMRIFVSKEPRTLGAACEFYCDRALESAHSAEADAVAAADVLIAQVARYPDIPNELGALQAYCQPDDWVDSAGKLRWQDGVAVFAFGKYQGQSLADIAARDADYLRWMAEADFPPQTRDVIRRMLAGDVPAPRRSAA
jgi:DNA polymerase-3 subunit epsilon